VCSSKTLTVLN